MSTLQLKTEASAATVTGTNSMELSAAKIRLLRSVCLLGLGICSYLAWTAFSMQPLIGCGSGGTIDCGHVLNSTWSKVLGIPVSVPAVGLYLTMLSLLLLVQRPAPEDLRQHLWTALQFGFFAAAAAAIWFTGLQLFVLKHICPWCIAAHCCGLILAGCSIAWKCTPLRKRQLAGGSSLMSVALLITLQSTAEPEVAFEVEVPQWLQQEGQLVAEPTADSSASDASFSAPSEPFAAPGATFSAPGEPTPPAASEFVAPGQVPATSPPAQPAAEIFSAPFSATLPVPEPQKLQRSILPQFLQSATATFPWTLFSVSSQSLLLIPDEPADPIAAPPEPRQVTVAGQLQPITLIVDHWPGLGPRDADLHFVELFDYTCPHCRELHASIKEVMAEFDGRVGVLTLPVPLERACNDASSGSGSHAGSCELSQLAIAVWRCNSAAFPEYHDWLFNTLPSPAAARSRAEATVGAERLQQELASGIPGQYVARHVTLYKQVGAGSVPRLLFSRSSVKGAIPKRQLSSMIRKELRALPSEVQ